MNSIILHIGYQIIEASSPGEGVYSTGMTQQDIEAETRLMNSLRKKAFIFGASVLKVLYQAGSQGRILELIFIQ